MANNKSKARKLAEFLRNLTEDAKLTTEAVEQTKLVSTKEDLVLAAADPTVSTFTTSAAVTDYVSSGYLPNTHDITLTFGGDLTGSATITDMGDTSISLQVVNDSHTHNTQYYTKAQSDTSLSGKVDKINIVGATVGSSTAIPVITYNTQGQITAASTTSITVGDGAMSVTAGTGLSGGGQVGTANQTGASSVTISHADTSSVSNIDTSGKTVIDALTFDGFGHVTGATSRALDFYTTGESDSRYDKYVSWTASDGTNTAAVTTGETVKVVGSGATSVAFNPANQTFTVSSTDTNTETTTTLAKVGNELRYTNEAGTVQTIDLSLYLDDTNLARIISGTMNSSGVATFTRDDSTTFTVDMSVLLDDTNLSRIVSASWNTSTGVLTLTRNDSTTVTVDLDDRYAYSSHTHSYLPLSGGTITGDLTINSTYPQINFNGTSDAGVDMAIKATPEGLDFYEPEDGNKIHFQILDDTGVNAVYGYQWNGQSLDARYAAYGHNHDSTYSPIGHSHSLTLNGDVSGSGTVGGTITVTVNNDSHSHSNYVLKTGDTATGDIDFSAGAHFGASGEIGIGDAAYAYTSVGHNASVPEGIFWHTNSAYGIYREATSWSNPTYSRLIIDWPVGIDINGGSMANGYTYEGVNIGGGSSNALKVNGNTVWNAGNDGSGSGLDADLLDGHDSSYFATSGHTHYFDRLYADGSSSSGTLRLTSTNEIEYFNSSGVIDTMYLNYSASASQLKGPAGAQIWMSSNDGSGSGLDADLLDGYHESSFWRDNQVRTVKALQFTGEGGNSGNGVYNYAIYQEGGAWSNPFPDLVIGFHTGIKIGGYKNYNGTRFYNDAPGRSGATEIFSVGDGDDNTRVRYNLHLTGANAPSNFAYLNIGYAGAGETRAIDIDGGWSAGENKSITWTHGSNASNIVAQINAIHDSPGSRLRFGKLYHSGDSPVYGMELISTGNLTSRLDILGPVRSKGFTVEGGSTRIVNPGGATYRTTSSVITGAIAIKLPSNVTNSMMRMTIKVYEYTTNESFEIHCGGYYYTGPTWQHNPFAYIIGNPNTNRNFTVRFGHDGSTGVIYIGETNSTWSYPQVGVTEVLVGYSGYGADLWENGWSISFATTFSNVTATISNCQVGKISDVLYDGNDTGYYVDPNGTSNFNTLNVSSINRSPTVTLSGDVTGSATMSNLASINISTTVGDDSHAHSQVYIPDTRGAARAPSYYPDRNVSWDFQNSSDTAAGGDTWHVVNTIAKWSVYDPSHRQEQIAFTGTNIKHRTATSDSAWGGWATFWDSNNDGSGSGLDADTIDGIDSSRIVYGDGNTGKSTSRSSFYAGPSGFYFYSAATGAPTAEWYNWITCRGNSWGDGGEYSFQLANNFWNDSLYVRRAQTGTYHAWNKIWHSGNDGSGSGLDADALDGLDSGSFLRSDANDSFTGNLQATNGNHIDLLSGTGYGFNNYIYGGTDNYLKIEGVLSSGVHISKASSGTANLIVDGDIYGRSQNASYSNLYRFGGIYFTWDSDSYGTNFDHSITSSYGGTYGDDITINSYHRVRINIDSNNNNSTSTEAFEIGYNTTGTGNILFTVNPDYASHVSDMRSPLFYDSVSTGYYCDPASDSNFNTLTCQGNALYIRGSSPTLYFRDTNNRSAMIHNNSNLLYILRGSGNDSTSWTSTGAGWPLTVNLENNDATFGGNVTAYSDARLKENVRPLGITIEQFKSVQAKRFDWIESGKHDIGFIAQDVEAAGLVEVVKDFEQRNPETGELNEIYKTLDYSRMVAMLWDVVGQQQTQIEELKAQVQSLKEK